MRNPILRAALVAAFACLASCKKAAPAPAPVTVPPPPAATGADGAAQPVAPSGVSIAQQLDGEGVKGSDPEKNRAALNQALQAWLMRKPELPKDLNELVGAKLISRVPPPPPGMKWAIDKEKLTVVVAKP